MTATTTDSKLCLVCRKEKSLSDFPPSNNKASTDRRARFCKECALNMSPSDKQHIHVQCWRKGKSDHISRQRSQKRNEDKFRVSPEEYAQMFEKQGGVCAICKKANTRVSAAGRVMLLAVDHDHVTGKVRGLLCTRCNLGIGYFRDNPTIVNAAVAYLEKNS
jgi:hypothetical protein